ncbi:MAG: hypothetical protein QM765_35905 [Myxococcales bacterium]
MTFHLLDATGRAAASSFPVFYANGNPTSRDLIDVAVRAGALTAEQALTYRVFALFKDSRLPSEYTGDDSQGDDSLVLRELQAAAPTLSAAAKDTLGPFLVPPIYNEPEIGGSGGGKGGADPCNAFTSIQCPVRLSWSSRAGTSIRVWYLAANAITDDPLARDILDLLETRGAAAQLNAVAGGRPIPDEGGLLSGGDSKLDFILLPRFSGKAVTAPVSLTRHKETPVYVILSSTLAHDDVLANAVHEYMHAIQFSMPLKGENLTTEYPVISEGTAAWAQHYVFHDLGLGTPNHGHWRSNKFLFEHPELGIPNLRTLGGGLGSYAAWLFFLCLEHNARASQIAVVLAQAALFDERGALAATVKNHPIPDVWARCSVSFWNRAPVHDLNVWDDLPQATAAAPSNGAAPVDHAAKPITATAELGIEEVPASLPFLAASYKQLSVTDASVRSVGVFNGLTYRHRSGHGSVPFEAPTLSAPTDPATVKGAALWALTTINGVQNAAENWSDDSAAGNGGYHLYCREVDAERLDEVVLISSFADPARPTATSTPEDLPTRFLYSKLFCEAASAGTAHLTRTDSYAGTVSFDASNYVWKRDKPYVVNAVPGPGKVVYGFTLEVQSGSFTWTASGTNETGCTVEGSLGDTVSAADEDMRLQLLPFATSPASNGFVFAGFAPSEGFKEEWRDCPAGGPYPAMPVHGFGFPNPVTNGISKYTVQPDGRTLQGDGSFTVEARAGDQVDGNWSLHSSNP